MFYTFMLLAELQISKKVESEEAVICDMVEEMEWRAIAVENHQNQTWG